MELLFVVVGRDKDPLIDVAEDYLRRASRLFPAKSTEVKEEPAKKTSIQVVKAREAEKLARLWEPADVVVALDEGGKQFASVPFAEKFRAWRDEGRRRVVFVVGGPFGLADSVKERADLLWSLSELTLPHRLARLVACEQLYRATTILRGEPYHHE